jgi:putative endonuclease
MGAQMQADIRADRGMRSHLAGLAAEDAVARHYDAVGRTICARRWRGQWGEIDLIARDGNQLVLIEVKQSRTHDEAASHLTERQMQRIWGAGSEFLAGEPKGQMTDVQIDVALVDGMGRIEILPNAYAA